MGIYYFLVTLFISITCIKANNCFKPDLSVFANFCSDGGERSVVGDFDGDGYDDLLCQNSRTGVIEIMYSNQNAFKRRLWLNDTEFCIDKDSELLVGDFDGNKKDDLLCHNKKTGMNSYAYSTADGNFYNYECKWFNGDGTGGTEIYVGVFAPEVCVKECVKKQLTDSSINGATVLMEGSPSCYCEKGMSSSSGNTYKTCYIRTVECSSYITGDGSGGPETSEGSMSSDKACTDRCIQVQKTKPDIVGATVSTDGQHRCYCEYKMDGTTGSSSYKACGLLTKRYSPTWGWCGGSNMQLLVGDLNGDGRSDILCHRLSDGYKYIAYATRWGHITKENWQGNHQKCDGEFLLGNFNSDGKADALCYNHESGSLWTTINKNNRVSGANDYENSGTNTRWCTGTGKFLRIADINGDGLDDIICKDNNPEAHIKVIKNKSPNFFDEYVTSYSSRFCINSEKRNFYAGKFSDDKKSDLMCLNDIGRIQIEESHCI